MCESLYGKRLLQVKRIVYKSYIRLAILYDVTILVNPATFSFLAYDYI